MDDNLRLAWFAGLFEGEGYFMTNRGKPRGLAVKMTDEDIIYRLQECFGGVVLELKPGAENHKKPWRWQLTGQPAIDLAKKIYPYLFSRRQERCRWFLDNYVTREQYLSNAQLRRRTGDKNVNT